MYDAFEARDTVVIAVAQEDEDLESHAKFYKHFEGGPRFEIVADLGRTSTPRYDRTSTYLIDPDGIVRQIFPQTVRHRASWSAVLNELKRMETQAETATTQPE